ncbi:MAG: Ycf66 family protein, partial [Microcystaceae cyanobacterium]
MLAFILAIAIGLASLVFFFSAFFAPKLHRKDDFLWSGIGFFYALVLWICATRITGGVLLGQGAA